MVMKNFEILIVDDDHIFISLNTIILEQQNIEHALVGHSNGSEAMNYLDKKSQNGEIQYLVLLDIVMPVMDGWEFLDQLQQKPFKDQVSVALVTASVGKSDEEKAKGYIQVEQIIKKPLTLQDIEQLKTIEKLEGFF